jgi:hypothetical protein
VAQVGHDETDSEDENEETEDENEETEPTREYSCDKSAFVGKSED